MPSIFIWHNCYAYSGRNSYINPPIFGKSKIISPYWSIPKSDHLIGQFQNKPTLFGNSKVSPPYLVISNSAHLFGNSKHPILLGNSKIGPPY